MQARSTHSLHVIPNNSMTCVSLLSERRGNRGHLRGVQPGGQGGLIPKDRGHGGTQGGYGGPGSGERASWTGGDSFRAGSGSVRPKGRVCSRVPGNTQGHKEDKQATDGGRRGRRFYSIPRPRPGPRTQDPGPRIRGPRGPERESRPLPLRLPFMLRSASAAPWRRAGSPWVRPRQSQPRRQRTVAEEPAEGGGGGRRSPGRLLSAGSRAAGL